MNASPIGGRADASLIDKACSETKGVLTLRVRLRPGASANRIEGLRVLDDGQTVLLVRVNAAAEKGKANKALIALLAKALRCPKSGIAITAGAADRRKTFSIAGPPADTKARLFAALRPER